MINANGAAILQAMLTALVGMWGLSVSLIGYCIRPCNMLQRILFFFGGLLLVDPGVTTDLIGAAILAALYMWQKMQNKADAKKAKEA